MKGSLILMSKLAVTVHSNITVHALIIVCPAVVVQRLLQIRFDTV